MNSTSKKFIFSLVIIVISLAIPIILVSLFFIMFSDFYSKGFLTGLTHIIICLFMLVINFAISTVWLGKYFQADGEYKLSKLFLGLLLSLLAQCMLNILLENPFTDPPVRGF